MWPERPLVSPSENLKHGIVVVTLFTFINNRLQKKPRLAWKMLQDERRDVRVQLLLKKDVIHYCCCWVMQCTLVDISANNTTSFVTVARVAMTSKLLALTANKQAYFNSFLSKKKKPQQIIDLRELFLLLSSWWLLFFSSCSSIYYYNICYFKGRFHIH